jgi:hypothetical protein
VHFVGLYCINIHFNDRPSTPWSSKRSLSLSFPHQDPVKKHLFKGGGDILITDNCLKGNLTKKFKEYPHLCDVTWSLLASALPFVYNPVDTRTWKPSYLWEGGKWFERDSVVDWLLMHAVNSIFRRCL